MPLVKKNIIANLIGSGWVALMSFVFIPFYIHFLGIESYGLVGFYMTLQAVMFLLDLGLTATVSRGLARLSVEDSSSERMRTLVRTLEILYLSISVAIIMLMGFVIAARMPFGFYSGGLIGLQRQVLMNVVRGGVETVRNGGVVLILWLVSPSITAFFLWQVGVSILGVCLMAFILWRSLPACPIKPVFSKVVLQHLWRFAAGMSGIALVSILLMQMDKIILSRMLPLDVFAYYTLASVVAMSLYFMVNPIVTAYAPKLTQLVAAERQAELILRYHQGCQLVSVMVFPVAITIALFSFEVLFLWTHDKGLAEHSYQVLSILIIGTALNGIMNIPYALQVAYAWTKLAFWLNVVMLLLLFPLLIIMTQYSGIIGAASVWLILNVSYVLVGVQIMHKRIMPDEKLKWYVKDVLYPCLASLAVVATGRFIVAASTPPVLMFLGLTIIALLSFLAAILAAPLAREKLFSVVRQRCCS